MTKNYDAFTLAEVLITLVIIGVIVSMTIPTLINKTNKQEYVSRLKKTYSTLSQATNRIIADNGMPRGDIGGWATNRDAVFNLYKKYLSNAKECLSGTECSIINSGIWNTDSDGYKLILADGTLINISLTDPACNMDHGYGTTQVCQYIDVDINGHKKPNKVSEDSFSFAVKENGGLYPLGCEEDKCNNSVAWKWGCTCKVIREGAINY